MKKNSNKEMTVKFIYKKEGAHIVKILTDYVLLFIGNEVKKLCS